jgi:pyruvate formate-lyase activating enzyme-like uncharacterized protein
MDDPIDLNTINAKIQGIKKAAEELKRVGINFPALSRNADRILASIKMLEINITDCVDLDSLD